jgi:hypothetical protein
MTAYLTIKWLQTQKSQVGLPSWLSDLLNVMKNFSFRYNYKIKKLNNLLLQQKKHLIIFNNAD